MTRNGDTYPETADGWVHYASEPPAQRWLDDGKLFIDSRADWYIYDSYSQNRPGEMSLEPGEMLDIRWRMKVDEVIPSGSADSAVHITSDDWYEVRFEFRTDHVYSVLEPGNSAPYEPNEFHDFAFETLDMRTYHLYVDGALAFDGILKAGPPATPAVGWGDMSSARGLAEWDWFACGIVPEPSAVTYCLLAFCAASPLRRSAIRACETSCTGEMT